MNKLFLYLVVIGILILVLVSAWELFQVTSGAKSTGELTVVEITNTSLISKSLEDHLKLDPEYSKFVTDGTTQQTTDTIVTP